MAGDGSLQRYLTIPQVIFSASGMQLELLSQKKGDRLSLQTCVDNVSMRTEFPQKNKGGRERDFLTSLISQKGEVYSLFSPFLSGKGNEREYI